MDEGEVVVGIPDKCRDCAVLHEAGNLLIQLALRKQNAMRTGQLLMGDTGEKIDAIIENTYGNDEVGLAVKNYFRQTVGMNIDDIDQSFEDTKRTFEEHTVACSGVFKMRATSGGTTYTVSVCTSPLLYFPGQRVEVPVYIHSKEAEEA